MKLKQKNVLVYGLGKSGLAAGSLLQAKGANVFLYDDDKLSLKSLSKAKKPPFLYDIIFHLTDEVLSFVDLVILNPAVSVTHKNVMQIKENNIPVISELELGYLFCRGSIIAVTGTNGKTTTVELITHILKSANRTVQKTGNIGTAFCQSVMEQNKGLFVLEVSSFQLETVQKLKPHIACFLNLSQDHLNRHHTMDEYLKQKAKLFDNMSKKDYAILNADDNKVKELSDSINAKTLFFSIKTPVKEGVFVENNKIVLTLHNKKQVFCKLSDISYLGEHNLSNILCAILVASLMKLKKETIISAINRFKLSPHRLQFVANKQGVDFYDDSKATNVDACLKAVGSFQKNIVLMLGGSDKCENFDELFQKMPKNVVHIVVSGENAQNIIKSANQFGFKQLTEAKNFKDSFEKATQRAKKHEIVLLAPASASFDEFKNYAERGEVFQKLVQAL